MHDEVIHNIAPGHQMQQLVPNRGTRDRRLGPEDSVLCLHRGEAPYEDMFNSEPFCIAPGFFMTAYGAALHFRARSVVPGSRNPETQKQVSFIVIIGIVEMLPNGGFRVLTPVDKPEEWTPFTAEERAEYEGKAEALDRENMVHPVDDVVEIQPVNSRATAKPSRIKGGAGTGRGKRGPEATDPAALEPIPPSENRTLREIAAGRTADGTED